MVKNGGFGGGEGGYIGYEANWGFWLDDTEEGGKLKVSNYLGGGGGLFLKKTPFLD
jgi:hypothetical protein